MRGRHTLTALHLREARATCTLLLAVRAIFTTVPQEAPPTRQSLTALSRGVAPARPHTECRAGAFLLGNEEVEGMPEYRTGRRAPFVMVPHALLQDERVDGLAIAVWAAIAAHADFGSSRGAAPSDERVSGWAGCSPRTVANRRAMLRELGWLEWESGRAGGVPNQYLVHAELFPQGGSAPGAEVKQGGSAGAAEGGYAAGADDQEPDNREEQRSPNGDLGSRGNGAEAPEEDAAVWMHAMWQEVLGTPNRELALTRLRRQKYHAMYTEQLAEAPEPRVAWRAVLYAVTRSAHHMSERAYQMPESFLRNPERRDRWVEQAIQALRTRGRSGGDEKQHAMRVQLQEYFEQRRGGAA